MKSVSYDIDVIFGCDLQLYSYNTMNFSDKLSPKMNMMLLTLLNNVFFFFCVIFILCSSRHCQQQVFVMSTHLLKQVHEARSIPPGLVPVALQRTHCHLIGPL